MADDAVTKAELALQLGGLRDDLGKRLYERIEQVEITLLKEFRKYAITSETRLHTVETIGAGLMERMAAIEERVGELERGRAS